MPNLPDEIIADILSRLPVSSLCRFRCVSKPWFSLISDPHFVKTHLNRNTNEHERLILVSRNFSFDSVDLQSSFDFYSVDLKSFQFRDDFEAVQLKFPPKQNRHRRCLNIWGSCDGLLLMVDYEYFSCFLVNPSTREYRKLPKSPFSINGKYFSIFGLGYDSANDDYKVVRISQSFNEHNRDDNIVSVYTLRTNSWRRIQDSPCDHSLYETSEGILVSGALHWLASYGDDLNESAVIVSLDLADESFQFVPPPNPVVHFIVSPILGVLGGCLCLLVYSHDACDNFWVMKEYGVSDSWTKFTINYDHFSLSWCLSTTGDFLVEMNVIKLVLFNQREQKSKQLLDRSGPDRFQTGTYVESLVSPNCNNMIKSQYQASHKILLLDRALQARPEGCEANTDADLSKAKRDRSNEPQFEERSFLPVELRGLQANWGCLKESALRKAEG